MSENENLKKAKLALEEAQKTVLEQQEALAKAEKDAALAKKARILELAPERFALYYPNGSQIPKYEAEFKTKAATWKATRDAITEAEKQMAELKTNIENMRKRHDVEYDHMRWAQDTLERQIRDESPEGLERRFQEEEKQKEENEKYRIKREKDEHDAKIAKAIYDELSIENYIEKIANDGWKFYYDFGTLDRPRSVKSRIIRLVEDAMESRNISLGKREGAWVDGPGGMGSKWDDRAYHSRSVEEEITENGMWQLKLGKWFCRD